MVQSHFTNNAGCKNAVKLRSCGLYFKKTGIPYRLRLSNDTDYPTQAIQFFKQPKLLTTQVSHTVTRKNKRPNRGQRKSYEKP